MKKIKWLVLETMDFVGKGSLAYLAMGQIVHVKDCLDEKKIGIHEIPLIFTKGTCPNLLCHK